MLTSRLRTPEPHCFGLVTATGRPYLKQTWVKTNVFMYMASSVGRATAELKVTSKQVTTLIPARRPIAFFFPRPLLFHHNWCNIFPFFFCTYFIVFPVASYHSLKSCLGTFYNCLPPLVGRHSAKQIRSTWRFRKAKGTSGKRDWTWREMKDKCVRVCAGVCVLF